MTKTAKLFIAAVITLLTVSCDTPNAKVSSKQTLNDSTSKVKEVTQEYKAIKYVDSFINVRNEDIKRNNALKEHNESLCTKQMLPLIDKKGLYDDLPFKLVT
ncbi:MAG TPA: hypothetical protein VM187_17810, partial [Niastella sp.]|nr:hypothetical protein [Niastella sp.]